MSKFQTAMSKQPPHVFVKYTRGESKDLDQYGYGVVGSIPIGQLVGFIVRVQAELAFRNPEPCDDGLCVIAFDPATFKLSWFVDSKIPVDALVGILELIKCQLNAQTGLVNSAGKPIIRSK